MKNVLRKMAENQTKNLQFTIVALGDSVTNGCFLPDNKNFDAVYHTRLRQKLNFAFPNLRINMINSGIGGINTPDSVTRLERDVLCYKPELVIVCLGLNDITGGKDRYIAALEEIIAALRKSEIEVIYMTPNMVCANPDTQKLNEIFESEKYNDFANRLSALQTDGSVDKMFESAKETVKKHGAVVCDCYSAWRNLYDCGIKTDELLCNRINHPTENMHELFASMLFSAILTSEAE